MNYEQVCMNAVRTYFRERNNCRISASYYRDCVRAAIEDVRKCRGGQ